MGTDKILLHTLSLSLPQTRTLHIFLRQLLYFVNIGRIECLLSLGFRIVVFVFVIVLTMDLQVSTYVTKSLSDLSFYSFPFFVLTCIHIFSITRLNCHIRSLQRIEEHFYFNCAALRYTLISISCLLYMLQLAFSVSCIMYMCAK